MPETENVRKRRKMDDEIRQHVIDAATKAMTALGLEGVKLRQVAKRAGVSVGSIYNMFEDQNALIRIVNGKTYDELHNVVATTLEKAIIANKTQRERLHDLADAYLEYVESHQTRWLAVLSFNRSRTEAPPKWYVDKELALFKVIEDAISDFPGGKNDANRHAHARALWASIHGIVTMAVADGFLMQPIKDVRAQMHIIVNAVTHTLENED